MTETKAGSNRRKALPELIRKEIGSETNRRFLARMPAFKPDTALPDELRLLLGELDRAEERAQARP